MRLTDADRLVGRRVARTATPVSPPGASSTPSVHLSLLPPLPHAADSLADGRTARSPEDQGRESEHEGQDGAEEGVDAVQEVEGGERQFERVGAAKSRPRTGLSHRPFPSSLSCCRSL
ncbi:hypothetical protein AAT19DRAFT_14297, partial [Rhodotorula toruloides]